MACPILETYPNKFELTENLSWVITVDLSFSVTLLFKFDSGAYDFHSAPRAGEKNWLFLAGKLWF